MLRLGKILLKHIIKTTSLCFLIYLASHFIPNPVRENGAPNANVNGVFLNIKNKNYIVIGFLYLLFKFPCKWN